MKKQIFTITICTAVLLVSANCLGQCLPGSCGRLAHNLPPAQRLMEPGPGVGGPGPGVLSPMSRPVFGGAGIVPATAMGGPGIASGGCAPMGASATSQIAFIGVEGGEVAWDISGQGTFDSTPLVMPGRQNFSQGAIYRIKLTNLPDRPGVELYPTLEVAPVTPRTDAYLAHAPIPLQFTDEDLDQVLSGNFVTKVIYLPDPEFQELALAGVETLVSTRLDPGVDPIAEADRRGSIMAILRMGNLDLQLPGQGLAMQGGVTQVQYQEGSGTRNFGEGQVLGPKEIQAPYESTPAYETSPSYEGEISGPYEGGVSGPMEGTVPHEGYVTGPVDHGGGSGNYVGDQGGNYGGLPGRPQGMPTAGFAPQAIPPHMVAGMNSPQWGMPSVGTPIGLPGPPHIPLGHKAGLVKHTMRNRTRVLMPPPVHNMKINVKQRPGLSYPRPVNHVNIAENNRAGFRAFGGTVPPAVPTAIQKMKSWLWPGR